MQMTVNGSLNTNAVFFVDISVSSNLVRFFYERSEDPSVNPLYSNISFHLGMGKNRYHQYM